MNKNIMVFHIRTCTMHNMNHWKVWMMTDLREQVGPACGEVKITDDADALGERFPQRFGVA